MADEPVRNQSDADFHATTVIEQSDVLDVIECQRADQPDSDDDLIAAAIHEHVVAPLLAENGRLAAEIERSRQALEDAGRVAAERDALRSELDGATRNAEIFERLYVENAKRYQRRILEFGRRWQARLSAERESRFRGAEEAAEQTRRVQRERFCAASLRAAVVRELHVLADREDLSTHDIHTLAEHIEAGDWLEGDPGLRPPDNGELQGMWSRDAAVSTLSSMLRGMAKRATGYRHLASNLLDERQQAREQRDAARNNLHAVQRLWAEQIDTEERQITEFLGVEQESFRAAVDALIARCAEAEARLDGAVVLPEDWREQVAVATGNPAHLRSLHSVKIVSLIESWLPATVEAAPTAGVTPDVPSERYVDVHHLVEAEIQIARLTKDSAGRPTQHDVTRVALAVASAFDMDLTREAEACRPADAPNEAEWCNCQAVPGTATYPGPWHPVGNSGGVCTRTPLADMPHEEWRTFHTAATGVDPGPGADDETGEPAWGEGRPLHGKEAHDGQ